MGIYGKDNNFNKTKDKFMNSTNLIKAIGDINKKIKNNLNKHKDNSQNNTSISISKHYNNNKDKDKDKLKSTDNLQLHN